MRSIASFLGFLPGRLRHDVKKHVEDDFAGVQARCHTTDEKGHGREEARHYISVLRRAALSLLKNETTAKVGIKNKRLTAGWDESYLEKVLIGS